MFLKLGPTVVLKHSLWIIVQIYNSLTFCLDVFPCQDRRIIQVFQLIKHVRYNCNKEIRIIYFLSSWFWVCKMSQLADKIIRYCFFRLNCWILGALILSPIAMKIIKLELNSFGSSVFIFVATTINILYK